VDLRNNDALLELVETRLESLDSGSKTGFDAVHSSSEAVLHAGHV